MNDFSLLDGTRYYVDESSHSEEGARVVEDDDETNSSPDTFRHLLPDCADDDHYLCQ